MTSLLYHFAVCQFSSVKLLSLILGQFRFLVGSSNVCTLHFVQTPCMRPWASRLRVEWVTHSSLASGTAGFSWGSVVVQQCRNWKTVQTNLAQSILQSYRSCVSLSSKEKLKSYYR